jgi:hypothetical protein
MGNIAAYEHELLGYATQALLGVPGLTIIGAAKEKASVISFVLDECRSEDVGAALDREGVAVRAGHHCAQPILRRFGHETTVRPSLHSITQGRISTRSSPLFTVFKPRRAIAHAESSCRWLFKEIFKHRERIRSPRGCEGGKRVERIERK